LILKFGDGARVAIHGAGNEVTAAYRDPAHTGRKMIVTPEVKSIIRSGSVRFLMGEHSVQSGLAMLISSVPSKQTEGAGFCGAGSEEYVVLVQKKNNALVVADRYLLQSCLQSIVLDAVEPNEILSGLVMDKAAFSLTFSRLDSPPKSTITLGVRDAKFFEEETAPAGPVRSTRLTLAHARNPLPPCQRLRLDTLLWQSARRHPRRQNLSTTEMQVFARQFNLSETSFLLPSTRATARIRIFTPTYEMPCAGHPTLGSAHGRSPFSR
jgi:hypothetical protein